MIVHHGGLGRVEGPEDVGENWVILACNDSSIKVIDDAGRLLYQTVLDAAPTCCILLPRDGSEQSPTLLLYGLKNGAIGALELQSDEAIVLWEI